MAHWPCSQWTTISRFLCCGRVAWSSIMNSFPAMVGLVAIEDLQDALVSSAVNRLAAVRLQEVLRCFRPSASEAKGHERLIARQFRQLTFQFQHRNVRRSGNG